MVNPKMMLLVWAKSERQTTWLEYDEFDAETIRVGRVIEMMQQTKNATKAKRTGGIRNDKQNI